MAHKKSEKEVRRERDVEQLRKLATREARNSLETAKEWIDAGDPNWALFCARRAVLLLKAARSD